eukprot:7516749-Pyramimonas_sp.AAC.1
MTAAGSLDEAAAEVVPKGSAVGLVAGSWNTSWNTLVKLVRGESRTDVPALEVRGRGDMHSEVLASCCTELWLQLRSGSHASLPRSMESSTMAVVQGALRSNELPEVASS